MTSSIQRPSDSVAGKATSLLAPATSRHELARRARARAEVLPAATDHFLATSAPPPYVPLYGKVAPRIGLRRAPASKERDAAVAACVDKVMKRIDALPKAERIRAKVGQMVQYAYEAFTGPERGEKLKAFEQRIREGQVSSFLYAGDPKEAQRYQRIAVEESPLGIPLLFAWDVIHGMRTIFPIPLAMASSWNVLGVERASEIAGREAAEDGQHWTFTPMVDIARDPRWGRIAEGAGEDQFLGSRMAEAQIKGFGKYILTCAKHYAAYGAVEGGRDYNTTDMSLRRLHDTYLPPFAAAAKAGADTFMTSFNDLNGVPSTANPYLLREVLRERWGSNAMVVTDWGAVYELINHGVARTRAGAAVAAANAGVDMDMQSGIFEGELARAVLESRVPESTIDEACRRVLRLKAEMGLFDDPYGETKPKSPLERTAAREIAEDSIVLLRNDRGVLPLKGVKNIALIGQIADVPHDHRGSWEALGKDDETVTIRKGLVARAAKAGASVTFTPGNDREGVSTEADIAAAVKAAENSDVVVLVIGENADRSGEASSVQSIDLPGNQRELIKALQKTGKTIVAVLMNGRPLVLPPECDKIPALVESWQLGTEHGSAVASVLFGDKNPGAKLPVSFPVSTGQIPVHHQMVNTGRPATFKDGKPENRFSSAYLDGPNAPKFPFGFGLSYTSFAIGQPTLSAREVFSYGDQTVFVDVPVKNTGKMKGKETVQVYSRWEDSTLTQPMRKLAGFAQVELEPGESRVVRIAVPVADLAVHDNDGKLMQPSGQYKLYVGTDATCSSELSFVVR